MEPTIAVVGIPNYADARMAVLATGELTFDLDRCDSQNSASAAALHRPDTMLKYDTRDATRRRIVRRAAAIDED